MRPFVDGLIGEAAKSCHFVHIASTDVARLFCFAEMPSICGPCSAFRFVEVGWRVSGLVAEDFVAFFHCETPVNSVVFDVCGDGESVVAAWCRNRADCAPLFRSGDGVVVGDGVDSISGGSPLFRHHLVGGSLFAGRTVDPGADRDDRKVPGSVGFQFH